MTIKVFATATCSSKIDSITEGKEYAVLKITYPKLFPEGCITIINDEGELNRVKSTLFTFETK